MDYPKLTLGLPLGGRYEHNDKYFTAMVDGLLQQSLLNDSVGIQDHIDNLWVILNKDQARVSRLFASSLKLLESSNTMVRHQIRKGDLVFAETTFYPELNDSEGIVRVIEKVLQCGDISERAAFEILGASWGELLLFSIGELFTERSKEYPEEEIEVEPVARRPQPRISFLRKDEHLAVARMIAVLAKYEREDIIGTILKTGAFRHLNDEEQGTVTLATKLENMISPCRCGGWDCDHVSKREMAAVKALIENSPKVPETEDADVDDLDYIF